MGPPKGEIVSGSSHLIGQEQHVESAQNLFPVEVVAPLIHGTDTFILPDALERLQKCNRGRLNRLGDQVPRPRKKGH